MIGASQSIRISDDRHRATTTFTYFTVIAAVCCTLRIWYAGNLYQDDGLWFTAAEEILRGKALYREIFFDKPPALPLVYAGLFKFFGAHILTIRLFTIAYSIGISVLLYLIGKRLYDRRTGLIAAAMFSVFSTTYVSGDMQSLNTEFLMTSFYASGAYLLMRSAAEFSRSGHTGGRPSRLALAGGLMVGVAFQINPKGALDLIFFALILIVARNWQLRRVEMASGLATIKYVLSTSKLFALAVAGLIFAALPFLLYVAGTHSLSPYKLYVWDWGFRYAGYYPVSRSVAIFCRYGTEYFLINNTLLIFLLIVSGTTIRRALRSARTHELRNSDQLQEPDGSSTIYPLFESDATLLIWFAVSFLGVAAGGRFFAHYYFQVLPSLCLIGARGLLVTTSWLKRRNRVLRSAVIALLIIGFLYTLIRTHSDTATLAADWIRGKKNQLNRDARIVAATVRDLPDAGDAASRLGAESMREGGPRTRSADIPADYLFVWGNWPEVYYWSGLLPASQYLSSQPLTGVPADIWYGTEEYRSIIDEETAAAARAELARELALTPPKYIVDELGFRDLRLSIYRYPELRDIMSGYERQDQGANFPLYIRRSQDDR